MNKRELVHWFQEGAFDPQGPDRQDPYRQFDADYRGGQIPQSGPAPQAPRGTTIHGLQLGPFDMADNNKCPYELVRLKTSNVRFGSLVVGVRDIVADAGGFPFLVLACEISIFGWNSGVKQCVMRAQSNQSMGPVRWEWQQGMQYDSLSIESFYLRSGIEPGQNVAIGTPDDKAIVTAVFRFVTTNPVTPGYDIVMGS